MSPANVYKFFPSREAIVEASVEINLAVLQSRILEAVRQARKPAGKLEAIVLAMIREHTETLRNERQFPKLVLMATENRSENRSVGKEGGNKCRTRWSPDH